MNLKASQRRTPARPARPLHRTLAGRQAWQQRLVYGGAAALALSIVAWLLGLALPLHLGLTGLGLLLGLSWRFRETARRAECWAFGWIEARSGLAYLTAHELAHTSASGLEAHGQAQDSKAQNVEIQDPHGFYEAVRAQAARTGNLEVPPLQPWFLPLVVLALALALLPHLALPALRAPLAPLSQSPLEAPTPAPAESAFDVGDEERAEEASVEEGVSVPEAGIPDEAASDAADPDAERSFDTAGGADALSEVEGEQAALDRFLEGTQDAEVGAMQAQQGPSESTAPTQSARGAAPGEAVSGAEPQTRAAPEDAAGTPPDAKANTEVAETLEGGRATDREPGTGQDAAPDDDAEANGDPGLSDVEDEQGVSAEGPQAPQEAPSTNEEQRAQASIPETDRINEALARTGEPTVQNSATSDGSDEITQDIRDGQSSERGGTRAGMDIESSDERLGGPERAAERLSGVQGDGPTTLGGEALQQGQAPETLPQTGTPDGYRRAAEEVIREGRIPLEYQNIVRDYFR